MVRKSRLRARSTEPGTETEARCTSPPGRRCHRPGASIDCENVIVGGDIKHSCRLRPTSSGGTEERKDATDQSAADSRMGQEGEAAVHDPRRGRERLQGAAWRTTWRWKKERTEGV